jgi:hypothetical protein
LFLVTDEALDRFIEAPVSTLWDVLLELKLIDEMKSHSEQLAANPDDPCVATRVIVGLIRDIEALRTR